ncbi:MAG: hypothetical protein U5L06_02450 [Rhodovibrio sp.]|nr:hypothetical protein [Rhodovibrio sp.]
MLKLSNIEAIAEQFYKFLIPPMVFLFFISIDTSLMLEFSTQGDNDDHSGGTASCEDQTEQRNDQGNGVQEGPKPEQSGDSILPRSPGNLAGVSYVESLLKRLDSNENIGGVVLEIAKQIKLGDLFFQTLISFFAHDVYKSLYYKNFDISLREHFIFRIPRTRYGQFC